MNDELRLLFETDQAERTDHPPYGTPEYWALRERDRLRRVRVMEIIASDGCTTAEDFYHAALIFQHGDALEEIAQAHQLAKQSADLGHTSARWLAAASLDRWLMYQGQPQKFGTQFVPDGKRHRLCDVDPSTTNAERARWDVPTLAEQLERAEELNRNGEPMPPMDDAPQWLKDAVRRWESTES
ncbi:MAG: hypothetical protein K8L91_33315 [Anaerolineae bacterium]|nr:hypothetical protein [Anaerolineae bacterium]